MMKLPLRLELDLMENTGSECRMTTQSLLPCKVAIYVNEMNGSHNVRISKQRRGLKTLQYPTLSQKVTFHSHPTHVCVSSGEINLSHDRLGKLVQWSIKTCMNLTQRDEVDRVGLGQTAPRAS